MKSLRLTAAFVCIWIASNASAFRIATPQGSAVSLRHAAEFEWKPFPELAADALHHVIREDPKTHAIQSIVRLPPKSSVAQHAHGHDVTLLVLKGKLKIVVGNSPEQTLSVGSYIVIPDGTPHQIQSKTRFRDAWIVMTTNAPFDRHVTAASP
ncbi:MAG: hypothetical protein COB53_12015 [Elusimicrobia bacterium]|nr:MAG: hypothetical protein COB53_12015 [Elusimicrobiota bacterium]